MARFDGAFATIPIGGGVSSNLRIIARLLLARAIASGDVSGTVELFRSYVEKNTAPAIAVMAVSGVKTGSPVRMGENIQLVPMTSLPPSVQRGAALGQKPFYPRDPSILFGPQYRPRWSHCSNMGRFSIGELTATFLLKPRANAQRELSMNWTRLGRCFRCSGWTQLIECHGSSRRHADERGVRLWLALRRGRLSSEGRRD